jgi:Domain of unknown function (DUF4190)
MLGIVSLVLSSLPFVGLVLGICAVATEWVARGRIKRGEADNKGSTVAGIVLGIVTIFVGSAILLRAIVKSCGSAVYDGAAGLHGGAPPDLR